MASQLALFRSAYPAFALCWFLVFWPARSAPSEGATSWSRGTFAHPVEGISKDQRLSLWLVTQDSRLIGRFVYFQPAVEGRSRTAEIPGVKAPDGTFWPDVTLQVLNENTAAWKTIGASRIEGVAAVVRVSASESDFGLRILFDPYKPFIGKFKLGRIILKTGVTATFALENLEEPKRSQRD